MRICEPQFEEWRQSRLDSQRPFAKLITSEDCSRIMTVKRIQRQVGDAVFTPRAFREAPGNRDALLETSRLVLTAGSVFLVLPRSGMHRRLPGGRGRGAKRHCLRGVSGPERRITGSPLLLFALAASLTCTNRPLEPATLLGRIGHVECHPSALVSDSIRSLNVRGRHY